MKILREGINMTTMTMNEETIKGKKIKILIEKGMQIKTQCALEASDY